MTDYRIPRWFSEGLSVYEERRARPGWGDDWNVMFVRSFADGDWFKIADLDAAFQRPRTPQDVSIAYFEACRFASSLPIASASTQFSTCSPCIATRRARPTFCKKF